MTTIPFRPIFFELMDKSIKRCTARNKRYGNVGDIFESHGRRFRITAIYTETVGRIAEHHWKEEGCRSKDHFIEVWKNIHPKKGFVPDQVVWLHWFETVKEN